MINFIDMGINIYHMNNKYLMTLPCCIKLFMKMEYTTIYVCSCMKILGQKLFDKYFMAKKVWNISW